MALIYCPECGKQVSDKANACIHCGYPLEELKAHRAENDSVQEIDKEPREPQEPSVMEAAEPPVDTAECTVSEENAITAGTINLLVYDNAVPVVEETKKPKKFYQKKWVIGLAALVVAIPILAILMSCEHEWEDATCTQAKTCTLCGETEGEPLGHIEGSWTKTRKQGVFFAKI